MLHSSHPARDQHEEVQLGNTLATYIRGYYRVLSYNEKKKKKSERTSRRFNTTAQDPSTSSLVWESDVLATKPHMRRLALTNDSSSSCSCWPSMSHAEQNSMEWRVGTPGHNILRPNMDCFVARSTVGTLQTRDHEHLTTAVVKYILTPCSIRSVGLLRVLLRIQLVRPLLALTQALLY